jgi:hypothetical protein
MSFHSCNSFFFKSVLIILIQTQNKHYFITNLLFLINAWVLHNTEGKTSPPKLIFFLWPPTFQSSWWKWAGKRCSPSLFTPNLKLFATLMILTLFSGFSYALLFNTGTFRTKLFYILICSSRSCFPMLKTCFSVLFSAELILVAFFPTKI